jgi:hypothetical protein
MKTSLPLGLCLLYGGACLLFNNSPKSLYCKDVGSVWVKSVAGCGLPPPPPPPVWLTILGKSLTRPDLYGTKYYKGLTAETMTGKISFKLLTTVCRKYLSCNKTAGTFLHHLRDNRFPKCLWLHIISFL